MVDHGIDTARRPFAIDKKRTDASPFKIMVKTFARKSADERRDGHGPAHQAEDAGHIRPLPAARLMAFKRAVDGAKLQTIETKRLLPSRIQADSQRGTWLQVDFHWMERDKRDKRDKRDS